MHKEFAVDPSTLNSWHRLQLLDNCIGFEKGRLIASCPNRNAWLDAAYKACTAGDEARSGESTKSNDSLALPKAVEILERLKLDNPALLQTQVGSWRLDNRWINNVLSAERSGELEVDGIIAERMDTDPPKVFSFNELFGKNKVWNVSLDIKTKRTPANLALMARKLLRYSSKFVFVDPYFSGDFWFVEPMREFLRLIFRHRSSDNRPQLLELHLLAEQVVDTLNTGNDLQKKLQEKLGPYFPAPNVLVLKRWRHGKDRLHARYVLTDVGGIRFDHGLSSGRGTTDVTLLSEENRAKTWSNYISSPQFEAVDSISLKVTGSAKTNAASR